jgi:hypothetical protein
VVLNPYALLCQIPPQTSFFSVLDLKDGFFTIPLHPSSQPLFAFTWTDPITHHTQQLTRTVLPQGFRDSSHLFGQALQQDLNSLNLFPSKLIQYVDDIFLCSPSKSFCKTHTIILNSLAHWGYIGYQKVRPNLSQLQSHL